MRSQHFIAAAEGLERLIAAVVSQERIGLDTESNGFHAYFERVCLVQFATAESDWAVDVLAVDVRPLVPLLADPAREVILHAAENDVLSMKRDFGLTFGRIFDTHAAAKVLGIERVGLANLLAEQLGVALEEDEQRSDWGRRPLNTRQLAYAFADVRYLLPLRDKLAAQLAGAGREAEAQAEFARLMAKEPRPREFDPEGWFRMKVTRTLDGRRRAVLRELYLLRDACARELNRPPFKVLSDLFLAETARRLPRNAEDLERVPGASAAAVRKMAKRILGAVRAGLSAPPEPQVELRREDARKSAKGPPPEVLERYERLRVWRKARAEARKVEVQVIAPNAVLMAVAQRAPLDLAALAQVEGMDPFRLEQYGAEMLEVIQTPMGQLRSWRQA